MVSTSAPLHFRLPGKALVEFLHEHCSTLIESCTSTKMKSDGRQHSRRCTDRCQMSDYRSTEASTLMLKSLRKDFVANGLFVV